MPKIFLLILLFCLQLSAREYNSDIIDIEAKLFVKIALLEAHIQKSEDPRLNIYILAKEIDSKAANLFRSAIEADYPQKVLNKKVVVTIARFSQTMQKRPAAVIVLRHTPQELQAIATWANKNQILSFAYDPAYLKYGLLASLYFGQTTKPYFNKRTIQDYGFVFDPYLMQLSKFNGE